MNDDTLTALKASIRHWEENAAAESFGDVEIGQGSCALCRLFNNYDTKPETRCDGCPVFEKTSARFCDDTPYVKIEKIVGGREDGFEADDAFAIYLKYAKEELEFLKSLLPEEPK